MRPRSGFGGPGISKIPLGGNFGTGEHLPKPAFGNHHFANPQKLHAQTLYKKDVGIVCVVNSALT